MIFGKEREALTRLPVPKGSVLDGYECYKIINGKRTWRDPEGRFFQWDGYHGEIEVYNARGRHIAVWNLGGEIIKDAVKGRKIDVS